MIATVELDPGVSLQLRRDPKTTAESLDRVPAGATLEVLGYTEAPSEGLVGQPIDPNWLYVRYKKENGGATIGWVSSQYAVISQLGRSVALESLPKVDTPEAGYYRIARPGPCDPDRTAGSGRRGQSESRRESEPARPAQRRRIRGRPSPATPC